MTDFLTFTLAAPMASYGVLAGNERRGTLDRPGHSLLTGLVGAALGLRREDPKLEALGGSVRFAVLQRSAGAPMRDYHTVQTVPSSKRISYATRREALASGRQETALLTQRDYVTDALCFVAMALEADAPATLEACGEALRKPHFALYFGRRNCPLAMPLAPEIRSDCGDAMAALLAQESCHHRPPEDRKARKSAHRHSAAMLWPVSGAGRRGTASGDPALLGPGGSGRLEQRRSRPGQRSNWEYGLLEELVLSVPEREDGA